MLALAQGDCQPRSRKNPTVRVQSRDGAGHFPFKGGEGEIFLACGRWGARGKVKVNCTSSLRAWRAGLAGVGLRDTLQVP